MPCETALLDVAQVLLDAGYTWVDVRSALECDEVGKAKQALNIPVTNAKRVYSPEQRKKVGTLPYALTLSA